jgi:hypothetical protein
MFGSNVGLDTYHVPATHRIKLPRNLFLQGRAEVVTDNNGKSIKMIGTTQDVTEGRRAEDALRRIEEQLRQVS